MEQYRMILYCARFFAAAALIFFFLTSCTNYWLHAITCRSVNDTLEDEGFPLTSSGVTPQSQRESTDNATDLRSGIDSPSSTEILNRNSNSSGMSTSLPGSGLVQYQKGSLQHSRLFNHRFHGTLQALSQRESTDNATDLRSGIDSPSSTEILNRNSNSSGMSTSLPGSGLVQYQKGSLQRKHLFNHRFHGTILALADHRLNYHHEGFFWRCSFYGREEENQFTKFIYIYQPPLKCCIHAFHSPFPEIEGDTTKDFENSLFYRKLWSALMFLGVILITVGFLCIIYSACCQKYSMYKAIGVIFLTAGVSFTVSVIMYVCWISAVSQMIAGEIATCTSKAANLNFGVTYGWSFMAAPFAILFSLIAGLLFIKISGIEYKESGGII